MTEEWLVEAKSLEESEEKQSWWAERKSLGSLDTFEGVRGRKQRGVSFIRILITYIHQSATLKSSNTFWMFYSETSPAHSFYFCRENERNVRLSSVNSDPQVVYSSWRSHAQTILLMDRAVWTMTTAQEHKGAVESALRSPPWWCWCCCAVICRDGHWRQWSTPASLHTETRHCSRSDHLPAEHSTQSAFCYNVLCT